MKDAEGETIGKVISTSVDRMSPSLTDLLETIKESLEYNVGFVTLCEGFDFTGPGRSALLSNFPGVAAVTILLADFCDKRGFLRRARAKRRLDLFVKDTSRTIDISDIC